MPQQREFDWKQDQGGSAAENYDAFLGPAMFAPCAELLLDAVGVRPGARILDVACGTGIATRAAAQRAGAGGSVTGCDFGEPMLEIARGHDAADGAAPIEYVVGDAQDLPFDDASFDVVLCQHGFQFFPERDTAAAQIARVLKPGGVAAIACWSKLDRAPTFWALADGLREHISPDAADMLGMPFSVSPEDMQRLLADAGLSDVQADEREIAARFAARRDFATRALLAGPLGAFLHEAAPQAREALNAQVADALEPYATGDDEVTAPMTTGIATARKPS